MKQIKQSRHQELDIELIRSKGNIYENIIALSERVYRLRKGASPKVKDHSDPFNSGVITALLELQYGVYDGLQQSK